MSWRDRAISADKPAGTSSWRDRAISADAPLPAAERGVLENALQDVKDMAGGIGMMAKKGAKMLTKEAFQLGEDIAAGRDLSETPLAEDAKAALEIAKSLPGGLLDRAKEIVTDPVGSFKEHPVNTVLDVASVAMPVAKAAGLNKVAAAGAKAAAAKAASVADDVAMAAGRRSMGFTKRFLNDERKIQQANEATRFALEKGVIRPFAGTEAMAERAQAVHDTAGRNIGRFLEGQDALAAEDLARADQARSTARAAEEVALAENEARKAALAELAGKKRRPVDRESLKMSKGQREWLDQEASDVARGEPGYRYSTEGGDTTVGIHDEWHGSPSTYPEWMQGEGWTADEVLTALDKAKSGQKITAKQRQMVTAALEGRDEMARNLRAERAAKRPPRPVETMPEPPPEPAPAPPPAPEPPPPTPATPTPEPPKPVLFDPVEAQRQLRAMRPEQPAVFDGVRTAYAPIHDKIDSALATIRSHGNKPLSWKAANDLKRTLQELADWKSNRDATVVDRKIAGAFRESLDQQLEQAAETVGGRKGFQNFKADKRSYQQTERLLDALNNRLSSEMGNKAIGLTDTILLAPNLGVEGAAAVAAKKFLEKRGGSALAVGAHRLSESLRQAPQRFGKYATTLQQAAQRGPQSLAVTNFLLQQSDPAYRQMLEEQENGQATE